MLLIISSNITIAIDFYRSRLRLYLSIKFLRWKINRVPNKRQRALMCSLMCFSEGPRLRFVEGSSARRKVGRSVKRISPPTPEDRRRRRLSLMSDRPFHLMQCKSGIFRRKKFRCNSAINQRWPGLTWEIQFTDGRRWHRFLQLINLHNPMIAEGRGGGGNVLRYTFFPLFFTVTATQVSICFPCLFSSPPCDYELKKVDRTYVPFRVRRH